MFDLSSDWSFHADKQEKPKFAPKPVPRGAVENGSGEPAVNTALVLEGDRDSAEVRSLFLKVVRRGLVDNKNEVEVECRNPNSPLYAAASTTFEQLGLRQELLKGVYAMGFSHPSKIQEVALPALMADPPVNLIAQSQSGTGKTATFVLAMLHRVDVTKEYPQVLCLSPTYELAIQTAEVAACMGQYCPGVRIRIAIRGETVARGDNLTEQIVIGTPGKVLDWAYRFRLFDLAKITTFVLDEADIMVSTQGHQDQTYRIHRCLLPECHIMFFSATYDDTVMEFSRDIVRDPFVIRLKREDETLENIKQRYIYCPTNAEKYQALVNIYGLITIGQAMIFCHTRKTASWLQKQMAADGHAVALLSGDLNIEERLEVIDSFRAGKHKALITTNVLGRGIDVEQTTLVINWDLPIEFDKSANCETYLHRIGRTGRFGKEGVAVNLVDGEHSFMVLKQIEEHFGKSVEKLDVHNVEEIERLNV